MRVGGPFLVVVPLSTVPNWIREFSRWMPQMNVIVYVGDSKSREVARAFEFPSQYGGTALKFDVLITTYELVLKDAPILSRVRWQYLMVDEAHRSVLLSAYTSAPHPPFSPWKFEWNGKQGNLRLLSAVLQRAIFLPATYGLSAICLPLSFLYELGDTECRSQAVTGAHHEIFKYCQSTSKAYAEVLQNLIVVHRCLSACRMLSPVPGAICPDQLNFCLTFAAHFWTCPCILVFTSRRLLPNHAEA